MLSVVHSPVVRDQEFWKDAAWFSGCAICNVVQDHQEPGLCCCPAPPLSTIPCLLSSQPQKAGALESFLREDTYPPAPKGLFLVLEFCHLGLADRFQPCSTIRKVVPLQYLRRQGMQGAWGDVGGNLSAELGFLGDWPPLDLFLSSLSFFSPYGFYSFIIMCSTVYMMWEVGHMPQHMCGGQGTT